MRNVLMIMAASLLITACSYPVTRVEQSTQKPSLTVSGLASDSEATISVDGVSYGRAVLYNGRDYALSLEPGVHVVEVRDGDIVLFSEKVFLADGSSKAISVH